MSAFEHRQTDRPPIDLSGHRSSGISTILYPKLRQALGFPAKPVRIYDPVQQLAIVDEDVLDYFGIDTIELGRGFALEDEYWTDWPLPDGRPAKMPVWALPEREKGRWVYKSKRGNILGQMVDGSLYFEQVNFPFERGENLGALHEAMEECMWTAVASPPGPLISGDGGLERFTEGARALRAKTDRAVIGLFGGNLLEVGEFFYKMDNFLALLASEPTRVHRFLDKLVEFYLTGLESYLGAVGEYIDIILFGDDLGMQTGPLISPSMYREFFKPRHSLLWRRAKELSDAKVMLHCCGGIRPLIPDLIEAGLDAVNPVQTSCAGMNPAELKRDFGKELVFWGGGCDTQEILLNADPQTVRRHVEERISTLGAGGGFVFQQVHNIQANVPPENVIAMLETVNS